MSRNIVIGAAQLGPISRSETRSSAINRMIKLMEEAAENGVELIVFPELALTTFFPRWSWMRTACSFASNYNCYQRICLLI